MPLAPGAPLPTTYLSRLEAIHRRLKPRTYLEIGVFSGRSLALAGPETRAVGIDPKPELAAPLAAGTRIFEETSDVFFATRDLAEVFAGLPLELVFIDGMHLFEFVLRDFAHAARHCAPGARIVLHDTMPHDRKMAQRNRETQAWTGDVWKLVPCLRRYLPTLDIVTLDTAPTGLTIIGAIDPADTTLLDRYDEVVAAFIDLDFAYFEENGRRDLAVVADDLAWIAQHLPERGGKT
jgi:predicted O-methyltransferase YrrM